MTQPYYQRVECSLMELDDYHWDKCFTKFNCPSISCHISTLTPLLNIEYWLSSRHWSTADGNGVQVEFMQLAILLLNILAIVFQPLRHLQQWSVWCHWKLLSVKTPQPFSLLIWHLGETLSMSHAAIMYAAIAADELTLYTNRPCCLFWLITSALSLWDCSQSPSIDTFTPLR